MKKMNSKVLLSLLGIVLATPFVATALAVGAKAVVLVGSVEGDLLLVGIALSSLLAGNLEGRMSFRTESSSAKRSPAETTDQRDLRCASTITLGY